MIQLSVCEECFAKNPHCKVNAIVPRYINNFNVHKDHAKLRCGLCNTEIPCRFCFPLPVGKDQLKCGCGMVLKKGDHFDAHKRMHNDDRIFGCARCPKRFTRKDTLVRHLRTHTGEKPFLCGVCGEAFRQKNHLDDHQKLIHSDLYPYICQLCSECFKTGTQLNQHMHKKHDASYPPCVECSEKFYRRNDLRQHMAIHHHVTNIINDVANGTIPVSGDAPFYCATCDEPFINECIKLDHESANACEEYDDDEESPPKKKQKIDDDDLNDLILRFAELKINDD